MATARKKINTSEILELLRDNKDHTKFFYLYVSTSGRVDKRQQSKPLLPGQKTLDKHFQKQEKEKEKEVEEEEEDSDDSESSGDDNVEVLNTRSQPTLQENPVAQDSPGPALPSQSEKEKKDRKRAMKIVHGKILPDLLCPDGWKKVHDKDMKITYRSLYFKTIEKQSDKEDNTTHIQRVAKCREKIRKEVEKFKEQKNVNFKIDSLLSRPLLYDPATLQEQSMREGSTQRKRQTKIHEYSSKKTKLNT